MKLHRLFHLFWVMIFLLISSIATSQTLQDKLEQQRLMAESAAAFQRYWQSLPEMEKKIFVRIQLMEAMNYIDTGQVIPPVLQNVNAVMANAQIAPQYKSFVQTTLQQQYEFAGWQISAGRTGSDPMALFPNLAPPLLSISGNVRMLEQQYLSQNGMNIPLTPENVVAVTRAAGGDISCIGLVILTMSSVNAFSDSMQSAWDTINDISSGGSGILRRPPTTSAAWPVVMRQAIALWQTQLNNGN